MGDPVTASPRLGIIGGSGLYQLEAFEQLEQIALDTPFGRPSSPVGLGRLNGVEVAFISRHGVGHHLSPSDLPYLANVYAMKSLGVTHLVSISAVGSLSEEIVPGSFVVPDQIIDRTAGRERTFFRDGIVAHVSIADPFCATLSRQVAAHAAKSGLGVTSGGVYVCIEGPQFSTRAESRMFRSWGGSIIGMTAMPEARLAREAGLCYACLAMVTDWDVWHQVEEPVSVAAVLVNLRAMTSAVQSLVVDLAGASLTQCESGCVDALDAAIVTELDIVPAGIRERLSTIVGPRLDGGA